MIREQASFVEAFASTKLGRNARLDAVRAQVKWYRFEKLLRKLAPDGAGRPPFDALLMFKALLLQQWYGLSDAELEEALNDRVSFRRFLGLTLDADAPDHTTLCRFRNRLVEAGLIARLFAEFDRSKSADLLSSGARCWMRPWWRRHARAQPLGQVRAIQMLASPRKKARRARHMVTRRTWVSIRARCSSAAQL
jgi:transposase